MYIKKPSKITITRWSVSFLWWRLEFQIFIMLVKFITVSLTQVLRDDLFDSCSGFAGNQIVFAISSVIHIPSSNKPPYFFIFVLTFQFFTFGIGVVGQINGIVSKSASWINVPVGIGCSLFSHHLRVCLTVFSLLSFVELSLCFLPSIIFPFQVLKSLPLNVQLFSCKLPLSLFFIVGGEILFELLKCWIKCKLQSIWCVGALSALINIFTPVPTILDSGVLRILLVSYWT